jgi:ubiquinone/menaquinone biosynthesis C-methylase UbiE
MIPPAKRFQRPPDRGEGPKDPNSRGSPGATWHHASMTDQEARYDRIADGYAAWWSPVHRAATLRLLDEVADELRQGRRRVLDIGCGTGALAIAAVTRWPSVEVDGVDASGEMLRIAGRERAAIEGRAGDRLRYRRADATALPYDDETFDVALTAFVLQLVPSRFQALREARRVLRPGGRLAYVTWLRSSAPFAADTAYDEALAAVGLDPQATGHGASDDLASPGAAVAQLRRAGFSDARARANVLAHQFTPEGYLAFLERFDDEDRFASLDGARRARLEAEVLGRLRALPPEGLRLVLPIVYASGRRR